MSKFTRSYVTIKHYQLDGITFQDIPTGEVCLLCKYLRAQHFGDNCPYVLGNFFKRYPLTIEQYEYAYFKNLINNKEI